MQASPTQKARRSAMINGLFVDCRKPTILIRNSLAIIAHSGYLCLQYSTTTTKSTPPKPYFGGGGGFSWLIGIGGGG